MRTIPCSLCGYHAPREECPHCAHAPLLRSLARPLAGPLRGVVDGLAAVPVGLWCLATTRGTKRWLVPPFVVTFSIMTLSLWWVFGWFGRLLDSVLPGEISFGDKRWEWLEGLSDSWSWLKSTWYGLAAASEWLVNALYGLVTSRPLTWLGYFLVGSLVGWYCFSIVYEALAGPFLDEVQARFEKRWFGADPRSRLERPNDIPEERCRRRTIVALAGAVAILACGAFLPGLPWWAALALTPLAFVAVSLRDREYGQWLRWMLRVEGRATLVSLQAAAITGVVIVLALPLYFVPFGVGYVLFAFVTGFATAVGLLDIPFERRGIRLGQRLRFLLRNTFPIVAFGLVAGILLAIPLVGPLLMVPGASVGGLWLICRLDKSSLRPVELRRQAGARVSSDSSGVSR